MIKKTVVCDRCEKRKPKVLIEKPRFTPKNTVLCDDCVQAYYDLDCQPCASCGQPVKAYISTKYDYEVFCSPICAIRYKEETTVRTFTEDDEKMLLGENEEEED